MAEAQERRAFQTLDGLRGVGAFLVVCRHLPNLVGQVQVPESYLAVDLFYLVSGFVVAHAYGDRLKAGGFFKTFIKTRLIRLYPLYALGLALGVISALTSVIGDPGGWWTPGKLIEAIATGLLMIPFFPGLSANGSSLDGPTWTLLPELLANALYAAAIRFMTIPVILGIVAVSGVGVVYAELHFGGLDVGFGATDQWAALARVGYSFFAGVLVFRFFGARKISSELASWALVALLTVALAYTPDEDYATWYELGLVMVGFPLILIAAAHFEPGAFTGRMFSLIGLVSYGVYIIHQPIGNLIRAGLTRIGDYPPREGGPVTAVALIGGLLALSWWLDKRYDAPVRKVLRRWFMPEKAKA